MVNLDSSKHVDDPYTALNLPHTANENEIRGSYRQLAKKYHPDTWSSPCFSEAEKKHATEVFQRISAAHALLADNDKKAEYDRNYKLGLYMYRERERERERENNNNNNNKNTSGSSYPRVRPPPSGAPPPLPRGWITATDPASGSLYYCNLSTGKSSWTHPSFHNSHATTRANHSTASGDTQSGYGYGKHYNSSNSGDETSFPGKRRFPYRMRASAPPKYHDGYYDGVYDRTILTTDEPDTHRCGAFLALWLCPPLGIVACYHSIMVDRCWKRKEDLERNGPLPKGNGDDTDDCIDIDSSKRHDDLAHGHSKRAGAYACFGISIGIVFWAYILFSREDSDIEWPKEWSLDEWWPEDWDWGGNNP
jgi:curved DNA-binding protein CbpA